MEFPVIKIRCHFEATLSPTSIVIIPFIRNESFNLTEFP